jgi:hypothetical protein
VVRWTGAGARFKLFVNAYTSLPTAVEVERAFPYSAFWSVWGDVTCRVYFSNWELHGGVRYPMQWDEERNGQPYRSLTVTSVAFDGAADPVAFAISKEVRAAFAAAGAEWIENMPLGRPGRPAVELAPGIVQIPGWWNVALVRQSDGVVVLEAPISSGYSAKIIAEAERRFPGLPVKAVISTSDAWPHLGGVREYVARGVPVYLLDLNRSIVERALKAPHTAVPDALAKTPREAKLNAISSRTELGSGVNRIELYPVRGEGGERMVMVYFPSIGLLYGSDLVQKNPDGSYFSAQYLSELVAAAQREKLTVDRVFALHQGVTPWTEVVAAAK